MTYRSKGILKKHADTNWYTTKHGADFLALLERGELNVPDLLPYDLYGSECVDCEQKVTRFKYRGERYDLEHAGGRWFIHQCPDPNTQECWPDDPCVRDKDGSIWEGWSDESTRVREYPDDPYNYPDIPYVPPGFTKGD